MFGIVVLLVRETKTQLMVYFVLQCDYNVLLIK